MEGNNKTMFESKTIIRFDANEVQPEECIESHQMLVLTISASSERTKSKSR